MTAATLIFLTAAVLTIIRDLVIAVLAALIWIIIQNLKPNTTSTSDTVATTGRNFDFRGIIAHAQWIPGINLNLPVEFSFIRAASGLGPRFNSSDLRSRLIEYSEAFLNLDRLQLDSFLRRNRELILPFNGYREAHLRRLYK